MDDHLRLIADLRNALTEALEFCAFDFSDARLSDIRHTINNAREYIARNSVHSNPNQDGQSSIHETRKDDPFDHRNTGNTIYRDLSGLEEDQHNG